VGERLEGAALYHRVVAGGRARRSDCERRVAVGSRRGDVDLTVTEFNAILDVTGPVPRPPDRTTECRCDPPPRVIAGPCDHAGGLGDASHQGVGVLGAEHRSEAVLILK